VLVTIWVRRRGEGGASMEKMSRHRRPRHGNQHDLDAIARDLGKGVGTVGTDQ
jgi:hypothetical protein